MNLNREINISKKFILILILINLIAIGLYTSYAYFEISVIKNGVVVLKTASIDITTSIDGYDTPSFTLAKGESKTITVNLTTNINKNITYKMYYNIQEGNSTFRATSTTTFTNDIVKGEMNGNKTIVFNFQNTGIENIVITLGTQGGLTSPISLEQGEELILEPITLKQLIEENISSSTCTPTTEEDGITYISGTSECIDFNYVWYSGKLWRITAINSDGTMKMITDDTVTAISYGSNVNFYT